jgi:DNA-directed RNA polymerase specialized sigma24 family protein
MAVPWRRGYDEDFAAYYTARAGTLRNTAYLRCGDWHLAQDLTQNAFTKLYRAWPRLQRHDNLDQYARQVLVRAFLDERRRPWRRERTWPVTSSGLARRRPSRTGNTWNPRSPRGRGTKRAGGQTLHPAPRS